MHSIARKAGASADGGNDTIEPGADLTKMVELSISWAVIGLMMIKTEADELILWLAPGPFVEVSPLGSERWRQVDARRLTTE